MAPRTTKAPAKYPAKKASTTLPAVYEPKSSFTAFTASDYVAKATGYKDNEDRYLTVSPLRAVMDEQSSAVEHIVTERTRQGVIYGAGLGMEHKVLARIMGLTLEQLQSLYSKELETAPHLMMADITANLYNIARDPRHTSSVKAATYLLGKLGNRVYQESRTAQNALAINPSTKTIDPSMLNEDQRDALRQILISAMSLASPAELPVEGSYIDVEDNGDDLI